MSRHLVAKLGVIVLCTLAVGFGLYVTLTSRYQLDDLQAAHERNARNLASGLIAGLRSAMLSGNGASVRDLIAEAGDRIDGARVRVFDRNGMPVFEGKRPAPDPASVPRHVRGALAGHPDVVGPNGEEVIALPNEQGCRVCHASGAHRGVLTLGTTNAAKSIVSPQKGRAVVADLVKAGFVQVMTTRNAKQLDAWITELTTAVPSLRSVAVRNLAGVVAFGDPDIAALPVHRTALREGERVDAARHVVIPLENGPRCAGCHEPGPAYRGTITMEFQDDAPTSAGIAALTATTVRHLMLSGLGRLAAHYLADVARTGAVAHLTLHDAEGRLYAAPLTPAKPSPLLERAFSSGRPVLAQRWAGDDSTFTYVEPLANEEACFRCHSPDAPMRGAVAVVLDTGAEARRRQDLVAHSTWYGVFLVLIVLCVLYLGLRMTVLRPVRMLERAAERVGRGELDARVHLNSRDEIGRLSRRFNDMTQGLQERLTLSKFVSQDTMRTVAGQTDVTRGGSRTDVAVLFSDIRGFTAYSDGRQPEEVLDMLNHYLQIQAHVVTANGGDIDKFVGDGLMAVFSGPDRERRAVRCGVDLVRAVATDQAASRSEDDTITVGVGISTGPVVAGAMGAEERMDYTVVGSTVNLAARLCAVARAGQVLVSDDVARGGGDGVELARLDAVNVKGFAAPIVVFEASHRGKGV